MKIILTLLIAASAVGTLNAQTREETRRVILGERKETGNRNDRDNRDVVYGNGDYDRYPENGGYSNRRQADQINREYDNKINSIRNNRYLSNSEKERAIRQLERDRQQRLAEIDRGYNDRDRDRRYDDDYNRGNNGKHKGWYKKAKNKNWKKGNRDWRD